MQFGEMFRVLVRRWVISVPVLLLTIVAAAGAYVKLPTTYQSNAELTLIASKTLADYPGNGNNPYLALGGLIPLTGILITDLSSHQAAQQLTQAGVVDSLTVSAPVYDPGPFLTLTLSGKNPTRLLQSMPTLIKFTEQQLYALQQTPVAQTSVPANSQIKAVVISSASTPTPILKKKREVVAGIAIAGIIATFLLSFGVEAIARRRGKGSGLNAGDFDNGMTTGSSGPGMRVGRFDGGGQPGYPDTSVPARPLEPALRQESAAPARPLEPASHQEPTAVPATSRKPALQQEDTMVLAPALRQSTVSNELSLESEKLSAVEEAGIAAANLE
jgi:hypothetical protein